MDLRHSSERKPPSRYAGDERYDDTFPNSPLQLSHSPSPSSSPRAGATSLSTSPSRRVVARPASTRRVQQLRAQAFSRAPSRQSTTALSLATQRVTHTATVPRVDRSRRYSRPHDMTSPPLLRQNNRDVAQPSHERAPRETPRPRVTNLDYYDAPEVHGSPMKKTNKAGRPAGKKEPPFGASIPTGKLAAFPSLDATVKPVEQDDEQYDLKSLVEQRESRDTETVEQSSSLVDDVYACEKFPVGMSAKEREWYVQVKLLKEKTGAHNGASKIAFLSLWPSLRQTIIDAIIDGTNAFATYQSAFYPVTILLRMDYDTIERVLRDNQSDEIPECVLDYKRKHPEEAVDPDKPPPREWAKAVMYLMQEHLPGSLLGEWQYMAVEAQHLNDGALHLYTTIHEQPQEASDTIDKDEHTDMSGKEVEETDCEPSPPPEPEKDELIAVLPISSKYLARYRNWGVEGIRKLPEKTEQQPAPTPPAIPSLSQIQHEDGQTPTTVPEEETGKASPLLLPMKRKRTDSAHGEGSEGHETPISQQRPLKRSKPASESNVTSTVETPKVSTPQVTQRPEARTSPKLVGQSSSDILRGLSSSEAVQDHLDQLHAAQRMGLLTPWDPNPVPKPPSHVAQKTSMAPPSTQGTPQAPPAISHPRTQVHQSQINCHPSDNIGHNITKSSTPTPRNESTSQVPTSKRKAWAAPDGQAAAKAPCLSLENTRRTSDPRAVVQPPQPQGQNLAPKSRDHNAVAGSMAPPPTRPPARPNAPHANIKPTGTQGRVDLRLYFPRQELLRVQQALASGKLTHERLRTEVLKRMAMKQKKESKRMQQNQQQQIHQTVAEQGKGQEDSLAPKLQHEQPKSSVPPQQGYGQIQQKQGNGHQIPSTRQSQPAQQKPPFPPQQAGRAGQPAQLLKGQAGASQQLSLSAQLPIPQQVSPEMPRNIQSPQPQYAPSPIQNPLIALQMQTTPQSSPRATQRRVPQGTLAVQQHRSQQNSPFTHPPALAGLPAQNNRDVQAQHFPPHTSPFQQPQHRSPYEWPHIMPPLVQPVNHQFQNGGFDPFSLSPYLNQEQAHQFSGSNDLWGMASLNPSQSPNLNGGFGHAHDFYPLDTMTQPMLGQEQLFMDQHQQRANGQNQNATSAASLDPNLRQPYARMPVNAEDEIARNWALNEHSSRVQELMGSNSTQRARGPTSNPQFRGTKGSVVVNSVQDVNRLMPTTPPRKRTRDMLHDHRLVLTPDPKRRKAEGSMSMNSNGGTPEPNMDMNINDGRPIPTTNAPSKRRFEDLIDLTEEDSGGGGTRFKR